MTQLERNRRWSKKNPDKVKGYLKKYRDANIVALRAINKLRQKVLKYGVTEERYQEMQIEQDYKCAICGKPEHIVNKKTGCPWALSIDHNHKTGQVRKLLCYRCNTGIGKFDEDIELLKRAIQYLQQFEISEARDGND